MKTYLAVDYGQKRVGLAISRLWLSEPLRVVDISQAIKTIQSIVDEEGVDVVLVGIADGKIAEEASRFAQSLTQTLTVPVQTIDETLSTKTSDELVFKSGMSQSKRRQPRDHYAAAVFLQDFLDMTKED